MRTQFIGLAVTVAIAGGAAAAHAQDKPITSSDPAAALPPPAEESEPITRERPEPPVAGDSEPVVVRFQGARFEGARSVSPERLEGAWRDQVGRELTLTELRAIARRAEEIYADAGYPFVAVVVPPQEIRDGVVQFTVVEGRITDLTVLSNDPVARRQTSAAFEPLLEVAPLSAEDLERQYELARTTPGLSMAGALRRGSQPGGMDLVLQARRRPFRSYANINNLFSDPVGPWGALLGVDIYGASLYGDTTSIQLYSTLDWEEQQVLRLIHSRRINRFGTTIGASVLIADSNPQGVVAPLDLATDVFAARLDWSHPIISRLWGGVFISGAFDWSDQETKVFGQIALTEDRTRIASLRLTGRWRNRWLVTSGYVEGRQGLDIFDASRPGDALLSRAEGDPQATVFRAGADGEVKIPRGPRLYGRFEGQWTNDALLAPDEYSVGNLTIGRGYDPGSAFGDRAAAFTVEARWGPWKVKGPVTASPFVFYDNVTYWNEDAAGVPERTLDSFGGGFRFEWPGKGRLDVLYAEPRDAPLGLGEPEPSGRILVNLTLSLDDLADRAFGALTKGDRR